RDPLAVVPRVAPARGAHRPAFGRQVAIESLRVTNSAALALKIAAPRIALGVELRPIGQDMAPALSIHGGGAPLVEAKGAAKATRVGRAAMHVDVPRLGAKTDRGQPRLMIGQHLVEARLVEGTSLQGVVSAVLGSTNASPIHQPSPTGLRMLQLKQSVRLR